MKTKSQPTQLNTGNYLEQPCLQGLTIAGSRYANSEIKKAKSGGIPVAYGLIRMIALTKK